MIEKFENELNAQREQVYALTSANVSSGLGYETKFIPTDLVDIKGAPDFFAKESRGCEEDFSSFLAKVDKSFGSVFSMKSVEDFFRDVSDFYNPFREAARIIKTYADSVEVPSMGNISYGWGTASAGHGNDNAFANAVLIRCHFNHAKAKLPLNFFSKVAGNEAYVKSMLATSLSKAERSAFVSGDGNNKPYGILSAVAGGASAAQAAIVADAAAVTNGTKIAAIACELKDVVDALPDLIASLKPEYRTNASFMCSSALYGQLHKLRDAAGRYLFDKDTLFGYKVYIVDELGDAILFGNFKQGFVIADMEGRNLNDVSASLHEPGFVSLTLSTYCGAAVVLPEAIKALKIRVVA